jgi:hypothetical protein
MPSVAHAYDEHGLKIQAAVGAHAVDDDGEHAVGVERVEAEHAVLGAGAAHDPPGGERHGEHQHRSSETGP